jgi:two-component system NtrC family sensor kinase
VRWSISTKVFLGFTAVIVAFGSVGLYGVYRIHELRQNVRLTRPEITALASDVDILLKELETYESALHRTSASDSSWLKRQFRRFRPFETLFKIEKRVRRLSRSNELDDDLRKDLKDEADKLLALRTGTGAYERLSSRSDPAVRAIVGDDNQSMSNQVLFKAMAEAYVRAVDRDQSQAAKKVQDALSAVIGEVRRVASGVQNRISGFIHAIDETAQSAESRAMVVISIATGIALFIAVTVMILVAWTLRPLRRLQEGARRVAQGDFAPVEVKTNDEIGQLSDEFNRMAKSLADRDRQLEDQRRILLRAERLATIGKMSSQIAHEIRNPLASIGLNTELLEEELTALSQKGIDGESAPSETHSLLRAIRTEIDRLEQVTEQYLGFSRLPKPEMALERVNVMIGDLVGFMGEEMTGGGVSVSLNLCEEDPMVRLDTNQMRQALINLLRNSMESMGKGGEIKVSTSVSNGVASIDVSDNGCGISAEDLDKVFEPFFTTKSSGTGLGLALVQQIISDHDGTIDCRSSLGKGTHFTIELPTS